MAIQKHEPEVLVIDAEAIDRVRNVTVDYSGTVYCVTAHGRIFKRVADPNPVHRPGPVGFVWQEIEGPKL